MENTKYRAVPSETGVFKILEYLKGDEWVKVEDGIYDILGCRNTHFDFCKYLSSFNHSLENFVKSYPNIDDWNEQLEIKALKAKEKREKLEKKYKDNQQITYF